MYQFNLTGDPALKLKFPIKGTELPDYFLKDPGEVLDFKTGNSNVDSIRIQIFDLDKIPLTRYPELLSSNHDYLLPDSIQSGEYDIVVSWKVSGKLFRKNIPLSVSGPLVIIDSILPDNPNVLDSIQVHAFVQSIHEVDSVQLWVNNSFFQDMVSSGDGSYKLKMKIAPQPVSTITIYCRIVDSSGEATEGFPYTFNISDLPRFSADSIKLVVDNSISISSAIRNSSSGTGTALVEFQRYKDSEWVSLGMDTLTFSGAGILESSVNVVLPSGVFNYRAIVSTKNIEVTPDTVENNLETNAFWVTHDQGTTENMKTHSPVNFKHTVFNVEPGVIDRAVLLELDNISEFDNSLQPELSLESGSTIKSLSSDDQIPIEVKIGRNSILPDSLGLYQYFPDKNIWLRSLNATGEDSIIANLTSPGKFAFLNSKDVKNPQIKATVNGQKFFENSYVNNAPEINIIAQDKNGVDHRESTFSFWVNNTVRDFDISSVSGQNGHLQIKIEPVFEKTDTLFSMTIQDATGNISDTLHLKFIVSEVLNLFDYGNFPNPFTDITRFSYELTETVDDLSLEIFTVNGRLIRKLDIEESLTERNLWNGGYHELIWNGRTESGEFVANGVYFYLLKAKKGKKIISRRGKVAKAR